MTDDSRKKRLKALAEALLKDEISMVTYNGDPIPVKIEIMNRLELVAGQEINSETLDTILALFRNPTQH